MDGVHLGFLFEDSYLKSFYLNGVVVQLVRTPACHAGGHEFESRTHRRKFLLIQKQELFLYPYAHRLPHAETIFGNTITIHTKQ